MPCSASGRLQRRKAGFRRPKLCSSECSNPPKMTDALAGLVTLRKMTPADGDWLKPQRNCWPVGSVLWKKRNCVSPWASITTTWASSMRLSGASRRQRADEACSGGYDRKGRDSFVDRCVAPTPRTGWPPSARAPPPPSDLYSSWVCPGRALLWPSIFSRRIPRSSAPGKWSSGTSDADAKPKCARDCWIWRRAQTGGGLLASAGDSRPRRSRSSIKPPSTQTTSAPSTRSFRMRGSSTWTGTRSIRLSCYFQEFVAGMSYCMDLSDLAHYYKGHRKLIKHWQSVLPAERCWSCPMKGS